MIDRRRILLGALWLGIVVGLPIGGRLFRGARSGRCALDGDRIEPMYQVRVMGNDGSDRRFCCVLCAQQWLDRADPPLAVYVTDEVTGRELMAERAFFVRSNVVTRLTTGNRIHVFADRKHAVQHAGGAGGRLLAFERPLGLRGGSDPAP